MLNNTNDKYKPNNSSKILAAFLLIISEVIFISFFLSSNDFIVSLLYRVISKISDNSEKFNRDEIISLLFVAFFIIDFIVVNILLILIILKDDGEIKFEKLNELKRIEEKTKEFNNSYVVIEESIIDSKDINDKKKLSTKENPKLEFYKKYLDIIAEI